MLRTITLQRPLPEIQNTGPRLQYFFRTPRYELVIFVSSAPSPSPSPREPPPRIPLPRWMGGWRWLQSRLDGLRIHLIRVRMCVSASGSGVFAVLHRLLTPNRVVPIHLTNKWMFSFPSSSRRSHGLVQFRRSLRTDPRGTILV